MEDVVLRTDEPVEAVTACGVVCTACMEVEFLNMMNAECSPMCSSCMEEIFKSM